MPLFPVQKQVHYIYLTHRNKLPECENQWELQTLDIQTNISVPSLQNQVVMLEEAKVERREERRREAHFRQCLLFSGYRSDLWKVNFHCFDF